MGDLRREDTDRARRDDHVDRMANVDADREHEEGFDTRHARKQLQVRAREPMYIDAGERAFEGSGDQDRLWEQFEALLADAAVSARALELVRDMNGANRRRAAAELPRIAKVTTGGDLLVIAEWVGTVVGDTLDAALTCTPVPSAAQLRAYLSRVSTSDLVRQIGDAATVAKLRAVYPSPIAVVPQIADLISNQHMLSWFLHGTPHEQVAVTFVRSSRHAAQRIAKHLDQLGRAGWMWAFHVTDAITALNFEAVEVFAKHTSQADVGAFLQQKFDDYNAASTAMVETDRELGRELRKGKPDADDVVDDLAVVMALGADDLTRHRARFLAVASARQIDQATQLAAFSPAERLRWLVDGKRTTADELRDVLAAWSEDNLRDALDIKHVTRIRKRWPSAAPADVLGRVPDTLHGSLAESTLVRDWIVKTGQPNEILRMLTIWPGATAERAKWVGAKFGWDWLDRIGGGVDDFALRVLALNCGDRAITERIEKYLLGDHIEEGAAVAPAPVAGRAFEDPNDRFAREVRFKRGRELADASGELRAEDVAELKRDPETLARALASTKGPSLVRVLYTLDPPLKLVLQRGGDDFDAANAGGWVRTRSAADVTAALSDPVAAATARTLWPAAPLEVFPQLRQAAVLVPVLDANPDVLAWIVEASEPMSALKTIAASAVAGTTVEALEANEDLVELLPSGERLAPRDRTYLYGLANKATGPLKQRIMERISAKEPVVEDSEVDERAVGDDRKERDRAGFAEALELILDDPAARDEDIVTLCRERIADAAKLVDKHPALAAQVLARIPYSPEVLFPGLSFVALLHKAALVDATLDRVPGFVILRQAADDGALAALLARQVDARNQPFVSWLRRLPAASGLSGAEQAGLKQIFTGVKSAEAARDAFKARFGSPTSDSYDRTEIGRLWATLERLPRAHADQHAVSGYFETTKGVDGEFDPKSRGINMNAELIERAKDPDKDINPIYNRDDAATTQMTRDEAKRAFGLDDQQLEEWVRSGRLEVDAGVYTVKKQTIPDRFTGTALHEVGHAVDQMLGSNTELVFGLAGWKQYGDGDFDTWATELGGWDRVKPEDRQKIRDAWRLWQNSTQASGRPSGELEKLVPMDHPLRTGSYAGVGVVDFANDTRGHSDAPFIRNGRAYLMNGVYQRMYSVPMRTIHSAPSEYSLTAPEEYFAECYMTYYLTFDGTPATAHEKGKLLAPWIKKWFDDNIDRVGHNPSKASY